MINFLKKYFLFFLSIITVLIIDTVLAFKMFEMAKNAFFNGDFINILFDMPHFVEFNHIIEIYGFNFFFILLILTLIKTIILCKGYDVSYHISLFNTTLFPTYLNSFLIILCYRIFSEIFVYFYHRSESSIIFSLLALIIGLTFSILSIILSIIFALILFGGTIFCFSLIFIDFKAQIDNMRDKVKLQKEERLRSEAQSIVQRIDDQVALDVIIDSSYINSNKNNLTEFLNERRYIFDHNLYIKEYEYCPFYMTNDDKYRYYSSSIQKLYTEFKDILGYNTSDVIDTHEFLLSFKKDIEKYMNSINLSNRCVGIRKIEQSFLVRQRQNFINYYLNQRLDFIIKDNYSIKSGYEGEQFVNESLSIYPNLINLSNIRVEVNGRSIECDNIILSSKGIFILEVKNIGNSGNFKIVIEKDGRWLKKYEFSQKIETMSSATDQNNSHVAFINRLLNEECKDLDIDFGINGIVVISNNNVSIENNSIYQTILRADNVYNYINAQPTIYSKEQLEIIKQVLLKHNLGSKPYPVYQHIDELIQNTHQILNVLHKGETILKDHAREVESLYVNYSQYL